jgi:hypothetical protein
VPGHSGRQARRGESGDSEGLREESLMLHKKARARA